MRKKIINPKKGFSVKADGITRGSQYAFVTETYVLFVSCVLSDFWCIATSDEEKGF